MAKAASVDRGKVFVVFKTVRWRWSFVSQGFDGVEPGGFPCGVEAENNSDGAGDGHRGDDGGERQERGPVQEMGGRHGRAPAEENSHHAAGKAENHGFDEKLAEDIAGAGTDRHADA